MDRSIKNMYTPNPLSVPSNTIILDCITLMREKRISCLIVSDNKKPVGIFTEADMVRTLNKSLDYRSTKICELMNTSLITAPNTVSVFEATYLLTEHNTRYLIITDLDDNLIGIITQTDIIAHYGEDYFTGSKNVSHVMTKKILTVDKHQIVHDVIEKMASYTAGCAIVTEDDKPLGILTERDMATLIINQANINELTMAQVMITPVISVKINTSTFDTVAIMNREKVRRVLVVDKQKNIAGILIQEDIVRNLESKYIDFLKDILWKQDRTIAKSVKDFQKQRYCLENLLNSSLDMSIIVADLDFNVVYFNHDSTSMFQVGENKIIGQALNQLLLCDGFHEWPLEQITRELKNNGEYWFNHIRNQNHKTHHIESRLTQLYEEENLIGYILVSRDITDKLHTEKRLLLASHVFDCAIEGIMVTNATGTIQAVNPAFTEITGYSAEDAIGNNPRMLQSNRQSPEFYKTLWKTVLGTGRWQGEIWNRRKSGEIYPQRLSIASVKDLNGNVTQFTAVFCDITEIKEKEAKINHRAYHDSLTELPNRLLFEDRLEQAITRARRNDRQLTVMFVDIDNFKRLNDAQGHHAGDQFLQTISAEFRSLLRDQDTVSRFGGDEFTILLDDNNSVEQGIIVAQKILNLFVKPFQINDKEFYLGASIGIANYPSDGNNSEVLIKNADTAMYHAKANGRNRFQIFKQEMETRIKQRVSLESELRKALGRNQLEIHYQPIISLHTKSIISIEALLRWDNANNCVPPNKFIPIAEESGLIVPIGEWVLQQTCRQMSEWQIDDVSGVAISVNLSARQFREKELLNTIKRILDETHLKPEQLHLEITESSMMDDMESSIATLTALKKIGIRILMDDFGTGHSSLTCLQRFPVDVLKLDHTFIQDIDKNENSARLAAGIISMAKDLRLEVVAEGVENEAQLRLLEEYGCDMVQGYLFHKPLTEKKLREVLRQQKSHM